MSFVDQGSGRPLLLLHGGAGPASVRGIGALLAADHRVVTPVHPGFDGTGRPPELDTIAGLARHYAQLLDDLDLDDVVVVGNSIGGWIGAELALLHSPRVGALVLVDAVGLDLPDSPIVDFFSLTMDEVAELSYRNPAAFRLDVASLPTEQKAVMAGNRAALQTYGGTTMSDPPLLGRLPAITVPTSVVWGAADRIVPLAHGAAYANAIPDARLTVLDAAGHLPQLETPHELAELIP
ncbi:alpha/beta fold hydrolase [Pseudonocardia sp. CA-107938]|uniref:alpha/beta fold hydrolase n=1 Tax=Pseudonocardia sp. CA-107938 TaxID=3240021 RepID=UPI003D946CED